MSTAYPGVAFRPWKGDFYKQGIQGVRVLILGESHYHSCEKDPGCVQASDREEYHRSLTHTVVNHWKDHSHRSPVSHRVPALFELTKAEFWPRIAFFNFLQTFAGEHAKQRPASEQWESIQTHRAFQVVLDELKPDRILVLGKKTWAHLPSSLESLIKVPIPEPGLPVAELFGQAHEVDKTAYWYAYRPAGRALEMPVVHPSAVGFSAAQWTPSIDRWLAFKSDKPELQERA